MAVPEHHVGVPFRQWARTLKIYTDGKPSERRVSSRPTQDPDVKDSPFIDSDENPTLVEFKATDQVDVDLLLTAGHIAPYTAPKAKPKAEPAGLVEATMVGPPENAMRPRAEGR